LSNSGWLLASSAGKGGGRGTRDGRGSEKLFKLGNLGSMYCSKPAVPMQYAEGKYTEQTAKRNQRQASAAGKSAYLSESLLAS
jgi:hypothetical protein